MRAEVVVRPCAVDRGLRCRRLAELLLGALGMAYLSGHDRFATPPHTPAPRKGRNPGRNPSDRFFILKKESWNSEITSPGERLYVLNF